MPRGDRTGPMGAGPRTGRGAGYCAGYNAPGYANAAPGRTRGFGGGGRGWRHVYYATGVPGWARRENAYWPVAPAGEPELTALKEQAKQLGDQLAMLNQRIDEIEREG